MIKQTVLTSILLFTLTATSVAFSDGPWTGNNGTPPIQRNCTACHNSFEVNSGTGSLSWNVPETYQPGETYTLTIGLEDPDASRWGFQFSSMYDEIEQAGELTVTDEVNTQKLRGFNPNPNENNADFVEHTSAGTMPGSTGGVEWSFEWTAPEQDLGEIIFYLAGNAADGDETEFGDRIYLTQASATALTSTVPQEAFLPNMHTMLPAWPNPFNASTTVQVNLTTAATVSMTVHDLLGREVASLSPRTAEAGVFQMSWSPDVSSGTYIIRLATDDGWQGSTRVTLVK
ncbi:T9SS type A sorting domain-containing protein [bacterium]|nr:T9SS type A sorting domain-containing protein [bacterium]